MPNELDLLGYRRFHDAVVPGVADLHRMVRAIFDTVLPERARILISGAGGGRELETLGASPRSYELSGVDPSPKMLALARACIAGTGIEARTTLTEGVPADLPVIAEAVVLERLRHAGFRVVAPFYRGLWYAGWWSEAV